MKVGQVKFNPYKKKGGGSWLKGVAQKSTPLKGGAQKDLPSLKEGCNKFRAYNFPILEPPPPHN